MTAPGLARRLSAALAAAAATASIAAAAAPRARDADPLHLVSAGSAAVLRVDLAQVEQVTDWVRALGGEPALMTGLISLATSGALGFDALGRAGWRGAGLDADEPIYLAIDPVDPATNRARWHLRIVARVGDDATFAAWSSHIPALGAMWQPGASPGALAAVLGATARDEAAATRALTGRAAIAAGAIADAGALFLVRRAGSFAVIDGFAPARPAPLSWTRDGAGVLAALDQPAAGEALSDRPTPASRSLTRPGLALWTRPAPLLDTLLAWRRPIRPCTDLRALFAATSLADGAALLHIDRRQIAADLMWSAAAGTSPSATWPTADDGLIGPPPRAGAILTAALHLDGTAALRRAARPAMMESGWVAVWRRTRGCGGGPRALLAAFAWPELAAQWLDDVAATSPGAARLVGSFRNLGFAARRASAGDRRGWDAVLEGSLAPDGQAPAEAVLDAVFGGRRSLPRPRPHIEWDGDFLRPYLLPRGRQGAVLGVALGEARPWRLRQGLGRPRRPAPGGALARASGDAGALLAQLAPGLGARTRTIATAAAARVGSFDSELTVHADAVRASLTVRRR